MQILTLMALGAQSPGKEKAEIRARCLVCTSITAVSADIASRGRSCFRQISVFSVAARPFVVPDVENSTRLRGWLGFQGGWIHLWSSWPSFATYDLGLLGRRFEGSLV